MEYLKLWKVLAVVCGGLPAFTPAHEHPSSKILVPGTGGGSISSSSSPSSYSHFYVAPVDVRWHSPPCSTITYGQQSFMIITVYTWRYALVVYNGLSYSHTQVMCNSLQGDRWWHLVTVTPDGTNFNCCARENAGSAAVLPVVGNWMMQLYSATTLVQSFHVECNVIHNILWHAE